MTEPTQTAQGAARPASPAKPAPANTARPAETVVEAERRSFQAADAGARASMEAASNLAGAQSRIIAESGQRVGAATRQSAREVTEFWRASLDSMAAMQAEARELFDEIWRRSTSIRPHAPMLTAHPFAARTPAFLGQPACDMRETDDAYIVSVELPGLARGDIDVCLRGDVLTVGGHKSGEAERFSGAYRVSERRFGRFERGFPVPRDVDRARIEARVSDGVLTVVLPRSAEAAEERRKIEVKG